MNMTGQHIPYVYQVLVWGQDVRDADFDTTFNYATTPNPVAISPQWAEVIARDLVNEKRADQGLQLIFITLADFKFSQTPSGTGIWLYTDDDTGITVAIHETEVRHA